MNVEVLSQKISLLCPVSKKRIITPVLFADCIKKHPYAVCDTDSITFIVKSASQRFKEHKCPVCRCIPRGTWYLAWWMAAVCELVPKDRDSVILKNGHIYLSEADMKPFISNPMIITPPTNLPEWLQTIETSAKIVKQFINVFQPPFALEKQQKVTEAIILDDEDTTKTVNETKPVLPSIFRQNVFDTNTTTNTTNTTTTTTTTTSNPTTPDVVNNPPNTQLNMLDIYNQIFNVDPLADNLYQEFQSVINNTSRSPYATTNTNTRDTHNVAQTRPPSLTTNIGLNPPHVSTKKTKKQKQKQDSNRSKKTKNARNYSTVERTNIGYEMDNLIKRSGVCERRAATQPTAAHKELAEYMKKICKEFKEKFL